MLSNTKTKALTLLLVFSFVLVSLPKIGIVKAENSRIYIRADGKVAGTNKIKREGDVYTFTGDIGTANWSYGIIIKRDNIVVDGAGHLLKGHGDLGFLQSKPIITGIHLEGRNNVTIKNLHITGFNSGFKGNYCTNIKILGNNMTKIATNIIFQYSSHNIISGNKMINNGTEGIYLIQAHNNTIAKNYITDNYYGIRFWESSNNTVTKNNITESTSSGILIRNYSNYNVFSGNDLVDNAHGIGISASFNNTVSKNNMARNYYGIWLAGPSSNNTVTENNIKNNENGIHFRESSNNTIYHNNLVNNTVQVNDFGIDFPDLASPSVNQWDNGIEGNYWSDYNGTDNNGDGIGDTPYTVYENNTDRYPLMYPLGLDITPPSISIISPQNTTYTTTSINLQFTVDEETSWMGYSLDGQNNVTLTENILNLTALANGSHNITVYANDTGGNMGASETIYFTVDNAPPVVSVLTPENKTYYAAEIPLNFTVNEEASKITYCLDEQENVTISGNTTLTVPYGLHSITVYANDTDGNTGTSETISFTIAKENETEPPPPPATWTTTIAIAAVAAAGAALLIYYIKTKKKAPLSFSDPK